MKKNRYNTLAALLLGLLFACSLFVFNGFLDTVVTAKTFLFYGIVCLFLLLFSIGILSTKKQAYTLSFNTTDAIAGLYFFYVVVRAVFTPNHSTSSYAFISFCMLILVYTFVRWFDISGKNKNIVNLFHFIIATVVILQAFSGILQYFGVAGSLNANFRISGFFNNPGAFAIYMAGVLPYLLACLLFGRQNRFPRVYLAIGILGALVVITFSNSRTSWVASFMGLVFLANVKWRVSTKVFRNASNLLKNILSLAVVAILVIALGLGMVNYKRGSAEGRLFIWKTSVEMVKDRPLFGFGFDRYLPEHNEYQARYFKSHPGNENYGKLAANDPFAFNDYLQAAVELGIFGLILFAGIFASIFYRNDVNPNEKRKNDSVITGAKASLVALLTASLFSYPLQDISTAIVLFVSTGLAAGSNQRIVFRRSISKALKPLAVAGIVFSLMAMKYTFGQFKAQMGWRKAVVLNMSGHVRESFSIYQKISPKLQHDKFFLYNYGSLLTIAGEYEKGLVHLEKTKYLINDADVYNQTGNCHEEMGNLEEAIVNFEKASYLIPNRFYPKYRLVPLYYLTGDKEKAVSMAFEILEMDVKVESEEVKRMKKEIKEFLDNILKENTDQNE